jgi:superfamily II DNA helicase RecQ
MALSQHFIREVLRNTEFGKRVLSVVVDEAHVVSHWGASFRKKYGTLGIIRAFLPRGTPIVALSATLPARIRSDVLSKLQFSRDYVSIDIGNDRPNVSLVVRAIQHPMNTYADLDFVVEEMKEKKAFIYADNIATGVGIYDHLDELLAPEDRERGLIRPYNAALSKEYRREAMRLFRSGEIRVLICTDAAGMVGLDISFEKRQIIDLDLRVVTSQISILWSSGSCRPQSPSSCSALDELREVPGAQALLSY